MHSGGDPDAPFYCDKHVTDVGKCNQNFIREYFRVFNNYFTPFHMASVIKPLEEDDKMLQPYRHLIEAEEEKRLIREKTKKRRQR